MLMRAVAQHTMDENTAFYGQCRRDIWNMKDFKPEQDKVGQQLNEFRERMEVIFQPVLGPSFSGMNGKWWKGRDL